MLCYNVVETDVPRTVQWYGFRENFSIMGDMHTHIHDFLGWARQPLYLAGCVTVMLDT